MKKIFLLLLSLTGLTVFAQQKTISQAIITTKTTIIAPEGEDDAAPQASASGDGGERRVMMRFGDAGETKAVTYLKNDLVKTVIKTDMANTVTIRDNAEKKTTTLMEMMGNKTGFYATDADQEEMRKRMDSMIKVRSENAIPGTNTPPVIDVVYTDGTKKFAGFECKKALVIVTKNTSVTTETTITVKPVSDTNIVWYCPDIKLQGITSTGGSSGPFSFGRITSLSGLDKINGFPMEYEMKMPRGRKMVVEVTKLETDKEVKDKEFEIPKDYDIKPMKDMQNGGRGNFQIRVGG